MKKKIKELNRALGDVVEILVRKIREGRKLKGIILCKKLDLYEKKMTVNFI